MQMMWLTLSIGVFTGITSLAAPPSPLYHEIVLPLSKQVSASLVTAEDDRAIILHLSKVQEGELEALSFYDDRLVENINIEAEGPKQYKIRIQLRRNVKASAVQLQEPKRIVLSFFDREFMQSKDPVTQLPLSGLGEGGSIEQAQVPTPDAEDDGALQLLQPELERVVEPHELDAIISKTPRGRGRQWTRYPPYIYPFSIAPYQGRMSPPKHSFAFPLAEQAVKLFSYGDERQALAIFQQVLYKDPTLFSQDPLYTWALAECHFGDGNLTLSDSYYSTLHGTFPSSPLASLALLRQVDVEALTQILSEAYAKLPTVAGKIATTQSRNGEATAQILIRRAFWTRTQPEDQRSLPIVDKSLAQELEKSVERVESKKTGFLTQALVLKYKLQGEIPWTEHSISLTNSFFENYSSVPEQEMLLELSKDLENKLAALLQKKSDEGLFVEVVSVYESLPKAAEAIAQIPGVAWAVAEAYRNLQKPVDALPFYKTVSEKETAPQRRFYSLFWTSFLSAESAQAERLANRGERADLLEQESRVIDKRVLDFWDKLEESDKSAVKSSYRPFFEDAVQKSNQMQSAPVILLSTLTEELGKDKKPTESPQASRESRGYANVRLIHRLALRFSSLGINDKRRESLSLLLKLTPKDFPQDADAHQLWTEDLIALADDYRRENQFLDAGRIYTYAAENAEDWDRRAEAFYKGGLLLFRAGRRDASIQALTAASQDGNNFFYANLAKERLTTLQR